MSRVYSCEKKSVQRPIRSAFIWQRNRAFRTSQPNQSEASPTGKALFLLTRPWPTRLTFECSSLVLSTLVHIHLIIVRLSTCTWQRQHPSQLYCRLPSSHRHLQLPATLAQHLLLVAHPHSATHPCCGSGRLAFDVSIHHHLAHQFHAQFGLPVQPRFAQRRARPRKWRRESCKQRSTRP